MKTYKTNLFPITNSISDIKGIILNDLNLNLQHKLSFEINLPVKERGKIDSGRYALQTDLQAQL